MTRDRIAEEIKSIYREIIQAFNAHDAGKILEVIDRNDALRYVEHTQVTVGWDALRTGFEAWHPANQSLSVVVDESYVNVLTQDIAVLVASGEIHQCGQRMQKMTWTAVFQKKQGRWKIVNAHEAFSDIDDRS